MPANYTYEGDGIVTTHGYAIVKKKSYINYKWGENSILFVKSKAIKGCLEKVCIKKVIINYGPNTYNKVIPLYQDTLNSLWNENDLIEELDAKNLALEYWQTLEQIYQQQEWQ